MELFLRFTAPIIYILTLTYSSWVGLRGAKANGGRGSAIVFFILSWLLIYPLIMLFRPISNLFIPPIDINPPIIFFSLGIGFFLGLAYLLIATLVFNNLVLNGLFAITTIGFNTVSLYFYFLQSQSQNQDILIAEAWGFLLGVLIIIVITNGRNPLFPRFFQKRDRIEDNSRKLDVRNILVIAVGFVIAVSVIFLFTNFIDIGGQIDRVNITPNIIVIAGVSISAILALSISVLANQLTKKLDKLPPYLGVGLPIITIVLMMWASIELALKSK